MLDRAGLSELAANMFRITQSDDKIRREEIQGQERASDAHHSVGKEVRETIRKIGGTMPENLTSEPPIKTLGKRNHKRSPCPKRDRPRKTQTRFRFPYAACRPPSFSEWPRSCGSTPGRAWRKVPPRGGNRPARPRPPRSSLARRAAFGGVPIMRLRAFKS